MINIVGNWTSSLEAAGVAELTSPNGGVTLGGFIAPSSINPANWTRSYSRSAYIDSLPPRSNLQILPEATVVRLDISDGKDSAGNLYVGSVEYASNSAAPRRTIKVNKEVILSGGPLGSPKILMHSGVGPKDVLEAANVPLKLELPGVGQNLQDHLVSIFQVDVDELFIYLHSPSRRLVWSGKRLSRQQVISTIPNLISRYVGHIHSS